MEKLEKVIKAWECCNPFNRRCFECPYEDDCLHDNIDRVAIADMVELLKEQQEKIDGLLEDLATAIDDKDSALMMLKEKQPNEPMQLKYSETREEYWFYESICPKCGNSWISKGKDHFCPDCGQPVFEPCEEEQKDGDGE